MLDTIRQLTRQLKLKDVILTNFVPPEEAKKIEKRSKWNEELDSWIIQRLEFAGNNIRPRRPVSSANLRRPESEYARLVGPLQFRVNIGVYHSVKLLMGLFRDRFRDCVVVQIPQSV